MHGTYGAMYETSRTPVKISRAILNQDDFDAKYKAQYVDLSVGHRVGHYFSKFRTNPTQRLKKAVKTALPMTTWLANYKPKVDLASDFIAGCTVGVMNIPQGMAYGILTMLPPQFGLYTSFFPPLIYAFFGTSKQISFGTFAVISLMVRSVIEKTVPVSSPVAVWNETFPEFFSTGPNVATTTPWTAPSPGEQQIPWLSTICGNGSAAGKSGDARDFSQMLSVAFCLTFMVGLCQIFFGILQAGFLSVYLSDQLIEGLTTGAAVQVVTSQISKLFGITGLPSASGFLGVPRFYLCFACAFPRANWMTIVNSSGCLFFLIIMKQWVEPRLKKISKFPLPTELFVIILATVISYSGTLKENYQVAVVGSIPKGLPKPKVPDFTHALDILPDAIAISVVIFSISVSMGKLFAKKHDYKINANQEWFAYGAVHVISSFFSCHCAGASLSRSALQDSQGGRSQIASIFSSLIILVVLVALAPLFRELPQCALAAIIVVNLRGMFMQAAVLPKLWRLSKIDFLIWTVTFTAVVLLDITYGLIVGVAFAMVTVLFRTQWPDSCCLGNLPGTEIYKSIYAYSSAVEVPGVKIYRFDSSLYFANASLFKEQLYHRTSFDPLERKKGRKFSEEKGEKNVTTSNIGEGTTFVPLTDAATENELFGEQQGNLLAIIIDCSSFSYVDISGVDALSQIYEEYAIVGIPVLFSCVKVAVRQLFDACNFYKIVPKSCLYVTVHDAVVALSEFKRRSAVSIKTETEIETVD